MRRDIAPLTVAHFPHTRTVFAIVTDPGSSRWWVPRCVNSSRRPPEPLVSWHFTSNESHRRSSLRLMTMKAPGTPRHRPQNSACVGCVSHHHFSATILLCPRALSVVRVATAFRIAVLNAIKGFLAAYLGKAALTALGQLASKRSLVGLSQPFTSQDTLRFGAFVGTMLGVWRITRRALESLRGQPDRWTDGGAGT
jgi:hypothetical protein